MDTWQERLIDEERELREKLKKLEVFNRSKRFEGLEMGRDLLLLQESAMREYLNILNRRIELWGIEK